MSHFLLRTLNKPAASRKVSLAFKSSSSFRTMSSAMTMLPSVEEYVSMRDYCENSAAQNHGALLLSDMIEKNVERMLQHAQEYFPSRSVLEIQELGSSVSNTLSVVEYGCATGSSSLHPLKKIKAAAGEQCTRIKALMNDLPLNDWNSLQKNLVAEVPDIDLEISPQCMYKDAVAAEASVDIGYSCFAQHWLSEGVPCPLPEETGALWGNQLVGLPEYKDIHEEWAEKSREDWKRFLGLRSKEIRPGGLLVLLIQSSLLDGSMPEPLAEACQQAKKECLEESILTAEEARNMCMPEYCKSIFEILEPLQAVESPLKEKWNILGLSQQHPHILSEDLVASEKSDSEKSQETVDLARSFMDASLERALKGENQKQKLDQFWAKVFEIGKNDFSMIKGSFGVTLLALERTHK